jgi:hypothetical protein
VNYSQDLNRIAAFEEDDIISDAEGSHSGQEVIELGSTLRKATDRGFAHGAQLADPLFGPLLRCVARYIVRYL